MISHADIAATIRATWPPKSVTTQGAFDIGEGAGGGNRVSAARLTDAASDGASITPSDIHEVAQLQTTNGDEALFAVFDWQDTLDQMLAHEGFRMRDPTALLAASVDAVAAPPPPVSCFTIWPSLAVQEEIWQTGGIGPERLAIMERVAGKKTTLLGRINDRPAGTAFVALNGPYAMLHALEVAPKARRQGLARLMMGAAAAWAKENGAAVFSVLVTRANEPAGRLYASLGLKPVEGYHYRVK